jgi:hypothetical protein
MTLIPANNPAFSSFIAGIFFLKRSDNSMVRLPWLQRITSRMAGIIEAKQ